MYYNITIPSNSFRALIRVKYLFVIKYPSFSRVYILERYLLYDLRPIYIEGPPDSSKQIEVGKYKCLVGSGKERQTGDRIRELSYREKVGLVVALKVELLLGAIDLSIRDEYVRLGIDRASLTVAIKRGVIAITKGAQSSNVRSERGRSELLFTAIRLVQLRQLYLEPNILGSNQEEGLVGRDLDILINTTATIVIARRQGVLARLSSRASIRQANRYIITSLSIVAE